MGKGEKVPDEESESFWFAGLFLNSIKSVTSERR